LTDQLLERFQKTLGSTYTFEREIGGGGMSRVFIANDNRLGRRVAVKILTPELAAGVSASRFEREMQLAANLQQANIVPLLAAGDVDGLPYYTMPFVDGLSLRDRLTGKTAMSISESVSVLRDIARALAYAHGHGIVHRDIKPENILLSGGAAVVTDFGIAKALSASRTEARAGTFTQLGTSIGTPAYMAPEQAAGDPGTDHRADIYAFGCLAYEMLTGAPPFGTRASHQLFAAHISEKPVPLAEKRSDVPRGLAELVMRCLEKEPGKRPQSASEILHTLDTLSTGGHAASVAARRRWKIAAVVSGLIIVGTLLAWRYLLPGSTSRRSASGDGVRSIAVVPFSVVGGDTASAYFANGMSDEIAGVLAKVPELRLASRRSVDVVSARRLSPQEMGKQLGVESLLEGTVRRAGNQLRVRVQLTGAGDGIVRWSQSYDRAASDAFQLQDEIAGAIANELRVVLAGESLASARAGRTASSAAYDLYLRGRHAANTGTEQGLRLALDFYQQALVADPGFAKAHAGIGFAWLFLADAYVPSVEAYPIAREAASRALALDSLLADAHGVYGYATVAMTWSGTGLASLRRAVQLDPNSADLHFLYGNALCLLGSLRCSEGVREARQAVKLDPLSAVPRWGLTLALYYTGRYDEAIETQRALRALDPTFFYIDDMGAASLREKGEFDRAIEQYRQVQGLSDVPLHGLAVTYARMGRVEEARRIARELERVRAQKHVLPDAIAMIYANIGDRDRAFEWLDRARNERSALYPGITVLPEYAPIRGDPRFAALVRELRSR
jgi:eukaryotic-like serine/threonine-protein kinase